jgi:hypothetical protein
MLEVERVRGRTGTMLISTSAVWTWLDLGAGMGVESITALPPGKNKSAFLSVGSVLDFRYAYPSKKA